MSAWLWASAAFDDSFARLLTFPEANESRMQQMPVRMGTFHLLHGVGAITLFERKYPNSIFVISDLGTFGTNLADPSNTPLQPGRSPLSRASKPPGWESSI
jgi:hypothetical protein